MSILRTVLKEVFNLPPTSQELRSDQNYLNQQATDLIPLIPWSDNEIDILSNLLDHDDSLNDRKTTLVLEYGVTHFERAGYSGASFVNLLSRYQLEAFFIHPHSGEIGQRLDEHTASLNGNVCITIDRRVDNGKNVSGSSY